MYALRLKQHNKRTRGSSIAEVPIVLWFVFVLMLMPMLQMATLALRCSLMASAVHDGAYEASRCKTFLEGTEEKPAAVQVADDVIRKSAAGWNGLQVDSVATSILLTPIGTTAASHVAGKLTSPANTSQNIYQIETRATGHIAPLFGYNLNFFGDVPGLTTPLTVTYAARQMCENPQGLDK